MKILFVVQRFPPAVGGTEMLAEKLVEFLSETNEVTVYTTNAIDLDSFWNPHAKLIETNDLKKKYVIRRYNVLTPSEVDDDLRKFPFSISMPGPFSPKMWEDIINFGPSFDLIIVSSFPYNHVIPAYHVAQKSKIPIIVMPHIHLQFPEIYLTGLRLALINQSNAIVVNTNAEKNSLIENNIQKERIHIIPPSIESNSWSDIKPIDLCSKIGIKPDSIIILFVGNKTKEKGIMFLIGSLKRLWKKLSNIELVLIGPSTLEYREYIKNQPPNVKDHIHDLGIVTEEEKQSVFKSCDVLALPSQSESFGISYLEAWMCKKPVIACNIDAVKDVITDSNDGILVDFNDKEQLCKALEKLVVDSKLRDNLGMSGFQKIDLKYNQKNNFIKFESLCNQLIEDHKKLS